MTNWEHFKDDIFDAAEQVAFNAWLDNHTPSAKGIKSSILRTKLFLDWCDEEYVAPEPDYRNLPVDTLFYVRGASLVDWVPRYFAYANDDNVPYFWSEGRTSITAKSQNDVSAWSYYKLAEEGE